MKTYARFTLLTALLAISAKAAPFMAVGDNAELFVTASAAVQSDDNIYLGSSGKSDTVFSFTPGLDLVFGKGSPTTGDVYYREDIRRYSTHTKQNTELASIGAMAKYSNGMTKANFNASYDEIAQNQVGATLSSDIARRNVTNLGGNTEFGVSGKSSLAIGLTYLKTDYIPTALTSSDVVSIPVDFYYQYSPKLDWSVGYVYRSTKLSGAAVDNQDNFFNLGARGEFTPKLSGEVKFGFTERSFDKGGNQSLFGMDANLTYLYSEKTTLLFNGSNDFANSGTGDNTKNFTLGASVNSKLSEELSLNAGLSRRAIQYPTRTDDYIEGSIGAAYAYNQYLNFSATYTYRNNSSNQASAGSKFTNNVFSLGASVRY